MIRLVAIVFDEREVVGVDGTSLARGAVAVADMACAADALATFDVSTLRDWLKAHLCDREPVDILDVRALLRADGRADDYEGLLHAADVSGTSWNVSETLARAVFVLASRELSPVERLVLMHTTRENAKGLRVDRPRAAELAELYRGMREGARRELQLLVPGLSDAQIRGEAAFRRALQRRFNEQVESTAMGSAGGPLGSAIDRRQMFVQFANAASEMQKTADGPERIQDFLSFHGAHTGRFSSRGSGLHSLPKHPHPLLWPLVRQREVIVPSVGRWFVARDLSAIEARVLTFLAGETEIVAQFRAGRDVYASFASTVWPGIMIDRHASNAHLREIGKQAVLALGFGMGIERFARNVLAKVPDTSEEAILAAFNGFGAAFPNVRAAHAAAALQLWAIATGAGASLEPLLKSTVSFSGDRLTVELVTRRKLHYRNVRFALDHHGDRSVWFSPRSPTVAGPGRMPEVPGHVKEFRFDDGVVRRRLAPHTLVQNIVQAAARDIVVHMQARLIALAPEVGSAGLGLAFTVHDAIVAESRDVDWAYEEVQALLEEVMGRMPDTLPAVIRALPLASEREAGPRVRYG